MGRSSRIVNEEMKKGVWSAREDQLLIDHVKMHGEGQWGKASRQTGLRRCGKSVRLRWLNYLRPGIRRGNISEDEEELIIRLHKLLGNRWSLIAGRLPGRTDNKIKNYWNSTLRRKLGLENHSNKITKERKPSLTGRSSDAAASAEDDPHLSKNNGADGGGEGGMIKPTSSMHCFANHIVNEQEDAHPHHDATLSTVELAKPANKTNDLELGGEDDVVTWNDFMMDLNEGELDISEFLQTDFSRLCELERTSLPSNVHVGSCSTNNEQPPADYCKGCGSIVVVSAAAADNAFLP